MASIDSQVFESYVPVYDAVPEDWEMARQFLVEHLKKVSNAINIREIGWFLDEELLSGKGFIPGVNVQGNASPDQFRQIFRKVINFGALPNSTTKSVAHGINFDSNFTLIQMWASATDPINFIAFPIPYAGAGGNDGVKLYMDSTNVIISTQTNRAAYTRCFVVIEYMLEL